MNNEKLILRNQLAIMNTINYIMVHTCPKGSGDFQRQLIKCYEETRKLLYPKADLPYAESLFVKSSKGENK